jgi:hypothetical protein
MGQRRVALVRHVVASLALPVAALGALPVLRGPCAWSAAFLALFFLERLVHHRPVRYASQPPLLSTRRRRADVRAIRSRQCCTVDKRGSAECLSHASGSAHALALQ